MRQNLMLCFTESCLPSLKDPRHLQYCVDINESNVYYITQGKKQYSTPSEYGFCIKVRSLGAVLALLLHVLKRERERCAWIVIWCRVLKISMFKPKSNQVEPFKLVKEAKPGVTQVLLGVFVLASFLKTPKNLGCTSVTPKCVIAEGHFFPELNLEVSSL